MRNAALALAVAAALALTAVSSEAQFIVSNPNQRAVVVTKMDGSEVLRIPNYGEVCSFAHSGNFVFLAPCGYRLVTRIDVSTGKELDPIELYGTATALGTSANGELLFVGISTDFLPKVEAFRAATSEYVATFDVKGRRPSRIMNLGSDIAVVSFGGPELPPSRFSVAIVRDLSVVREFEIEGDHNSILLLGGQEPNDDGTCNGDFDDSGDVTVDEVLQSVDHALNGCPAALPR